MCRTTWNMGLRSNRCIRVINFLPGFRRILSSNARNSTRKVKFTKHIPRLSLTANSIPQTEFVPKTRCASLYSFKVIKMSRLTNYRPHSYSMVASRVALLLRNRPWNRLQNFFLLRHTRRWEWETLRCLELHPKPLHFLTVPICSCDRVFFCIWPKSCE